jgi:thiol-disulfide isomerase/thioredoxin
MYYVNNLNDINNIILQNKHSLILLYFGASWCGPCKQIKEYFVDEEYMKQFDNLCVIYIDADEEDLEDLFVSYGISSIPAQVFTILNDDNEVVELDRFVGFNLNKLSMTYNKHCSKIQKVEISQSVITNNAIVDSDYDTDSS